MSGLSEKIKVKESQVDQLADDVSSANSIFLTNYKGLSVEKITDLRKELRPGSTLSVRKNTILNRVFDKVGVSFPQDVYSGQTAIVMVQADPAHAAKSLTKFIKENETLAIKAGLLGSVVLTPSAVNELAKLPSREVLLGKLVSGINSPISKLVTNLSSPLRGFVGVLSSIKDKKTGGE